MMADFHFTWTDAQLDAELDDLAGHLICNCQGVNRFCRKTLSFP